MKRRFRRMRGRTGYSATMTGHVSRRRRGPAQARVAAMLLLTLRGTPTLYYGDELGLTDVTIPPALVQDPRELREPGLGLGRDPVRSPMPWDGSTDAGFSTVAPWLPLNSDWPVRNVGSQTDDASSILTLYRRLLAMRRSHSALSTGGFRLLDAVGNVLAYERWQGLGTADRRTQSRSFSSNSDAA